MIQDTHHPTLLGQTALAQAVLRELARKNVLGSSFRAPSPFDAGDCARHFGMDAEKWATMCDRTSEHYRRVAGYRYDPAERLEKARQYAEAARRIRSGVAPERAGIPGLGVEASARRGMQGSEGDRGNRGAKRDEGTAAVNGRDSRGARSIRHSFDLPMLEQDRRAAAQKSHGCHEMIPVGAFDHLADEASERSVQDPHGRADRNGGLFRDKEARLDHGVNLLQVSSQSILIGDVEDSHEPVSTERDETILLASLQEHVAGKERNDRLDPPSLWRAAFFSRLRQVIGDLRDAQLTGDSLFLAGLRVQAPPD